MAEEKKTAPKKASVKKTPPSDEQRILKIVWKKFKALRFSYKIIIILVVIGMIARLFEKL